MSGYQSLAEKTTTQRKYVSFSLVMILLLLSIAVILGITLIVSPHGSNDKEGKYIVKTNVGSFRGFKEILENDKVSYKFKGIPFAEPPVGNRRWKPPVSKRKLDDVYIANKSNTLCIQFLPPPFPPIEREPSEDCLYLHIHTPTLDRNANLPVFVWIHGGYLMNGYADMVGYYPDGEFASEMNVVAVSLQYRLNAFGYLSLKELWSNGTSYGNYGLLDQILGLEWVQDNIKEFGGNPDSVTVSGQSSGGTSVYALAASPLAQGLFKNGIPMSGSPYFPRNYSVTADDNRVFIQNSKCKDSVGEENIQDCLYELTSKEVVDSIPVNIYPAWNQVDIMDFPSWGKILGSVLVVEPVSLPVAPKDAYSLKELNRNINLLIGTTAQEVGLMPIRMFNQTGQLKKFIDKRLKPFESITFKNISDTYENVETYVKTNITSQFLFETIVTDARVGCPTSQLLKDFRKSLHLKNSYRYVSAWKAPGVVYAQIPFYDACHLTDAIALFGFKWWQKDMSKLTESQRRFMNSIRRVFKTFMVEGKIDGAMPGETIVFNGDGEVEKIKGEYHKDQCDMWNKPSNGFLPYAWIN